MVFEVENIEDSLKELNELYHKLNQYLIKTGLDYTNKIGGLNSEQTNSFFHFRDSIIHRLSSIKFHLNELIEFEENLPCQLDQLRKNGLDYTAVLGVDLGNKLTYYFEDIVFNLVSLLDYVGNLICYSLDQPKIDDWKSLSTACHPKSQNTLRYSFMAVPVQILSQEIANNKLDKYRNEVIHKKAHGVRVTSSIRISTTEETHEVKVYAPKSFIAKFKELKKQQQNGDEHTLLYAAFWIIERSVRGIISVLEELSKDFEKNRKIPKEDEPIIFSNV